MPHQTAPNPIANVLIDVVLNLLTPMFILSAGGDVTLARAAASHTIRAYSIRHQADIITVAQIVAFGLAALGSLSLSMDDALPAETVIRLRANANACSRTAEQNRRVLEASHAAPAPEAAPQPAPPAAADRTKSADEQRRTMWANAFAQVAREFEAEKAAMTPEELKLHDIRIAALRTNAADLRSARPPG